MSCSVLRRRGWEESYATISLSAWRVCPDLKPPGDRTADPGATGGPRGTKDAPSLPHFPSASLRFKHSVFGWLGDFVVERRSVKVDRLFLSHTADVGGWGGDCRVMECVTRLFPRAVILQGGGQTSRISITEHFREMQITRPLHSCFNETSRGV